MLYVKHNLRTLQSPINTQYTVFYYILLLNRAERPGSSFMINRRSVLLAIPFLITGPSAASNATRSSLSIRSMYTRESWSGEWPNHDASLDTELARVCRDPITGATHVMDRRLWDTLASVSGEINHNECIIISGYRSASTNNIMRGAPNSFHNLGRALDLHVPRHLLCEFSAAARRTGAGWIGVYRARSFVHIDTRNFPFLWEHID